MLQVAAGFFDTHDRRYVERQFSSRLGKYVDARSAGYVVDYHRQIALVGDRLIVKSESVLRTLVVVWGHDQYAVCALALSGDGIFHGGAGAVASRTEYHGHARADFFDSKVAQRLFFFARHSRRLAGSAYKDESVDTAFDLAFYKFFKAYVIYSRLVKRGDYRCKCTFKHISPFFGMTPLCDIPPDIFDFMGMPRRAAYRISLYYILLCSIIYSAICTALLAAPLRILSDTTQRLQPLSTVSSRRIRPT